MELLKTECPQCKFESLVVDVKIDGKTLKKNDEYQRQIDDIQARKEKLKNLRDEVYTKIYTSTKSINIGFIAERLFPALPAFRFKHSECRSTGGDPIDYVIFEGLSEGYVNKINFVDVKTGDAKLTKRQQEIRQVIKDRNVKFRTY